MRTYGIKSVFGRLTRGTLPVMDGSPVPFDVWLSPSVPAWDYQPLDRYGPYRMIHAEKDSEAVYGWIESKTFMGLITEFATEHMPRPNEACMILDCHPNIVLGWLHTDEGYLWSGCEYAFSILALHHPINAAIWERQARSVSEIDLDEWIIK